MNEIEENFTLPQLIIMTIIQQIQFDYEKNTHSRNRIVNKHPDPKIQNRKAWSML